MPPNEGWRLPPQPQGSSHIRLATIKGSWSGWPVPLAPRALPRFNATTEQSIPGVSIATFSLRACPLALFRLASHAKFSRSPPKPELSSCRLYTGCRLVSSQITSKLFPQDNGARGFDSVRGLSMPSRRFACAHLLNSYLTPLMAPFPRSLTTTPFECSSTEVV